MNGMLLIDKPQNFTSFDVVAVVRGLYHTKKAGHTGTLDPMATGVLPVLLGKATRAIPFLEDTDKSYLAQFQLGLETDTQDSTGTVLAQRPAHVTQAQLQAILPQFTGQILQTPPMYSAVRQNGQRLYALARQGITVERSKRPVTIYDCTLQSFDEATQTGTLAVTCSKGTYIRTLCHDIGRQLSTGAIMTNLRRTAACGFSIEQAVPLETLRQQTQNLSAHLIPVDTIFQAKPALHISAAQATRFANGGALSLERLRLSADAQRQDNTIYRVYDATDTFLGLGVISVPQSALCVAKLF